ncbi:MAG: NnrU family protein [Burkholderiales bacterium]
MTYLLLGLVIFLGTHSVRIVANDWRAQRIEELGEMTYKGVYSLLSALGLGLIVWGFGMARDTPIPLWYVPTGMRHAASLLTLLAFVLLAAAYVPGNGIKARVHHPMVLAVKTWALAHLLANAMLAHLLLFGAFLVWAVFDFIASRRRDRLAEKQYPSGSAMRTGITLGIGAVAWFVFAFWGHGLLIGIRPFG